MLWLVLWAALLALCGAYLWVIGRPIRTRVKQVVLVVLSVCYTFVFFGMTMGILQPELAWVNMKLVGVLFVSTVFSFVSCFSLSWILLDLITEEDQNQYRLLLLAGDDDRSDDEVEREKSNEVQLLQKIGPEDPSDAQEKEQKGEVVDDRIKGTGSGTFHLIFLLIGMGTLGYLCYETWNWLITTDVRSNIQEILDMLDLHVLWPEGSTIFDGAFASYRAALLTQNSCYTTAFALLCVKLLRPFHRIGRCASILAGAILCGGVFSVPFPDYLSESNVTSICPSCAPEFDRVVRMTTGFGIGLGIAAIIVIRLLPVIFFISPSLVRVISIQLCSIIGLLRTHGHAGQQDLPFHTRSDIHPESVVLVHTLQLMLLVCGAMGPLLSFGPMVGLYQALGDSIVVLLIALFLAVPPFVLFVTQLVYSRYLMHRVWTGFVFVPYYTYMLAYGGLLVSLLAYALRSIGVWGYLVSVLSDASFWCQAIAEFCLVNVIVEDLLQLLLGLDQMSVLRPSPTSGRLVVGGVAETLTINDDEQPLLEKVA